MRAAAVKKRRQFCGKVMAENKKLDEQNDTKYIPKMYQNK